MRLGVSQTEGRRSPNAQNSAIRVLARKVLSLSSSIGQSGLQCRILGLLALLSKVLLIDFDAASPFLRTDKRKEKRDSSMAPKRELAFHSSPSQLTFQPSKSAMMCFLGIAAADPNIKDPWNLSHCHGNVPLKILTAICGHIEIQPFFRFGDTRPCTHAIVTPTVGADVSRNASWHRATEVQKKHPILCHTPHHEDGWLRMKGKTAWKRTELYGTKTGNLVTFCLGTPFDPDRPKAIHLSLRTTCH